MRLMVGGKVDKRGLNALMSKIQEGDEDAFAELYKETCRGVFTFAYSIVGNTQDAEDIMQEAYIKVRRFAQSYTIGGNVSAWILQITKNLAYDFLRKSNRTKEIENIDILPNIENVTPNDKLSVYHVINKYLSLVDRQIVILHIVYGYKNREIAKFLDMPVGTVLWRYNKSMKVLREKLEGVRDEK